ncbi:MAG: chromosomal replication initiator protein DnaA [Halobacteriovoraceae bacterium]|nr:chromosomal replication initiator protein DnaA [Halobacteriovoraceae bacterium]|tara:strand:+ start:93 stop:1706 length:1614 start_codon:yes stop_codon:yes gene_type:complete
MSSNDFPFNHFLKNSSNENEVLNNISKSAHLNNFNSINNISNEKALNISDNSESDNELHELTNEVLENLKERISPLKFDLYFHNSFQIIKINNNEIHILTPSSYIKNQIEEHFKTIIENVFTGLLGGNYKVLLLTNEPSKASSSTTKAELPKVSANPVKTVKEATFKLDLTPTPENLQEKAESKYIQHISGQSPNIVIDPKKTFDNFIIGPSNNMAFVTMKAVADEPSRPSSPGRYPSIYIYSNSGLGKTHLLHSVANQISYKFPEMNMCLITAREFMKEMIEAIQNNKLGHFQSKYSEKIDVLMIDDIHELENKHGTQNEFFHIFNELHNKGKQLIFTSDKPPKEIAGIAERIRTRLQWGLVIDIQRPDFETRMAILKKKAYELDLFLPDDIISTIANSIKTSIRELEGSLIKLAAYSEVMKVDIDLEMVKELLAISDIANDKKITIEHITRATAHFYKITLADIKSKTRTQKITNARHIAMYLSQKIIGAKLQEIGRYFSGRDHTSVMHAIKKVKTSMEKDLALSRQILEIENSL